ncbi:hypothetical protein NW762_013707 [Fusarium torreyae]|uniref:Uncharacterized protein n=1 Tax=Fusarium torreyae TaxID=1237075 RepID=A0A9W8VA82_9HYPO|nr:hypothetical protein NW762_013707 [Fusarium torreyae]
MNQNAIPVNPKLQLEANVAFPGSGIDTRTLGSYVLDHRTFLEGHILPRLSGLCATCRVIPLIPQQSTPSPNQHLLTSRCCVGGDPGVQSDTKLEEQVKANAGYDFKYTGPRRYEWSREFTAPGNETQVFCYDGDLTGRIYRKYVISVRSSVVVTWETNADSLQFAALVEYKHWDGWRKDDANFPCSRTGDSISRSFTKSISWSVTVRLCASQLSHVPNGVIVPTVQGVSADTGLPYDYKEHCTDESLGSLTVSFTQALKDQLREVSGKLASTGAFIYPGAGQLDYGPPQLNELGDVVTTLNWLSYNEPRRMDYPQTVPLPPNTSQGRVCDLQVLLADRHSPLLNWNLMTWEYNEKWMKKISLLLFTWVTTERKVLGLTAKIGLPGPRAYINNLQITDGPWNYSDGLWTWTVSGGSGALIARNNGHIPNDGYTIPRDTMGLLLDVSGNVLGDLPLVVQVEEKWYCKDHAGNHLGLYATAFFSAKLDESATSAEKIDGEPISWVQAEDMIGRKISITE